MSEPLPIETQWNDTLVDFQTHIRLEKGLSQNTVEAYTHDVELLRDYAINELNKRPTQIEAPDIQNLMLHIGRDKELGPSSQARVLSGIRALFKYLLLEEIITIDPAEHIMPPKLGTHLPEVLSPAEVDAMQHTIDLSEPLGHRNLAIIETLYSCGLRVSELCDMKISNIYPAEQFIRIHGKGDKERLVPISDKALHEIKNYLYTREEFPIKPEHTDTLFLNRRGAKIGRIMIFNIVKEAAEKAGITKNVSPHTLRHSFATALVMGGADLRVVQAMLGHESIVTTEIYTHISREHLRRAILLHHPRGKL